MENTAEDMLRAAELLHTVILKIRAEQIKHAPRLEGRVQEI